MAYYSLQRYYKQPSKQQNIETKKQEKADVEESNARHDCAMYEVHLFVAVLVATVAFAAAFQLPGGYKPDGTPVLNEEVAFTCFLVFDTIAFIFSVATVYLLFYASRDMFRARSALLYMSTLLMVVSLIAMASAFVSGMYLISSKCRELAIVPFLMVGLFVLHCFFYWFIDPRGSYVRGLERPRRFFRKLVFRNSMVQVFVCDWCVTIVRNWLEYFTLVIWDDQSILLKQQHDLLINVMSNNLFSLFKKPLTILFI